MAVILKRLVVREMGREKGFLVSREGMIEKPVGFKDNLSGVENIEEEEEEQSGAVEKRVDAIEMNLKQREWEKLFG